MVGELNHMKNSTTTIIAYAYILKLFSNRRKSIVCFWTFYQLFLMPKKNCQISTLMAPTFFCTAKSKTSYDQYGKLSFQYNEFLKPSSSDDSYEEPLNSNEKHLQLPSSYGTHKKSPNSYDKHPKSPKSYDKHSKSPKSYDKHPKSPTLYDKHPRSPTSYDKYAKSPTSFDTHPKSPTLYDTHQKPPNSYNKHPKSPGLYDAYTKSPNSFHTYRKDYQYNHSSDTSTNYLYSKHKSDLHKEKHNLLDEEEENSMNCSSSENIYEEKFASDENLEGFNYSGKKHHIKYGKKFDYLNKNFGHNDKIKIEIRQDIENNGKEEESNEESLNYSKQSKNSEIIQDIEINEEEESNEESFNYSNKNSIKNANSNSDSLQDIKINGKEEESNDDEFD